MLYRNLPYYFHVPCKLPRDCFHILGYPVYFQCLFQIIQLSFHLLIFFSFTAIPYEKNVSKGLLHTLKKTIFEFQKLSRQRLIVYFTTLLLILLFLSAGALLYRISRMQNKYTVLIQESMIRESKDLYSDILQWHNQMHSKSAGAVHDHLDSNLDVIAQVRIYF